MSPRKYKAKAAESTASTELVFPSQPIERPRLQKLSIKNFGCIGDEPVTIDLDEIVVLVGPNNSGKSTILRAYEVVMSEGSAKAKLTLDDFPDRRVNPKCLPEIELRTVVYDDTVGQRWIDRSCGEAVVRERWIWNNDQEMPIRQGFDVTQADWAKDGVPWGAPNVAKSHRPQPHRIESFARPEVQAEQVSALLLAALKEQIKTLAPEATDEEGNLSKTDYGRLLDTFANLQKDVVKQTEKRIAEAEEELTNFIKEIFRGYKVRFDAKPEEDLTNAINFFKGRRSTTNGT